VSVLPVAEAHPIFCMMDTWCFLGTKRPGRAVDHLLAPSLQIVWRYTSISRLYIQRHGMGRPLPLLNFFTTVLYSMDTGTRYPGGNLDTYTGPVFKLRMTAAANLFHTHSFNLILLMRRIGGAPIRIPIYIQQDATLHSLFISGNCSTCLGWYFHPSSGAHTTVSTASGICHTVTAICRYCGRVGTGLSVLWVAYAFILLDKFRTPLCPS
jgi:hypothetical protein